MNEQSFSMTRVQQAILLMAQLLVLERRNTVAQANLWNTAWDA